MSYDVYLEAPTGGEPVTAYWANMTSNVAGMWQLALGGNGLRDFEGRIARDVIAPLEVAISRMGHPDHRAEFKAMEPSNGWGDHPGALQFLRNLLDACQKFPDTRIRVSC